MSADEYRQSDGFRRNREIYKYKFVEKWKIKDLSVYFGMLPHEVEEAIVEHKKYFQEEYE